MTRANEFIIYPAIDLRAGKVVRLSQGDPNAQKEYSNAPLEVAARWVSQGADWLHVVNLDGAFSEAQNGNLNTIRDIVSQFSEKVKVQVGGGFRSLEDIREAVDYGVTRIVVGTAAIEIPDFTKQCLEVFNPESIAFGLDALNGVLKSRGWQKDTGIKIEDFASQLMDYGARTIIYTDISRDGMERGVDIINTQALLSQTGLRVIASGGVSSLEDIRKVKDAGLNGVIIGRALYEKHFTLEEAITC
ncbi:MAG: 1-(5-phosphoribosyl)-5-[(5-phosphoribosylamino)methylideneamino]imidazole-4-carboxamide isomerase [Anaerolineales bacterium]|nr:1-(5-phosphoribosyl)-5-[(5-phosphoribosylamino)methylideneamino]imidazole-4-carboxamide isomerase [Anaerolineales bacterium]